MLVLADVAEVGTAEIPEQYTPSLTVLADETGLDRSTVRRHLATLETAGWVDRMRPTVAAARMNGERTRYRLMVPGSSDAFEVGADRPQVEAESPQPRGTQPPDLGAEDTTPRGTVPLIPLTDRTDQNLISSSSPTAPKAKRTKSTEHRPDVEKLCAHLADWMVRNECVRPEITEGWRTAARLLLDKDGRDLDKALALVDWCQQDPFWKSNVHSMPTFRKQYDRLRQRATDDWQRSRSKSYQPYRNPDPDEYERGFFDER